MPKTPTRVDLLILGAGWSSTFLIPLLEKEKVTYAATTTTGRDGTHKFKFEPTTDDRRQYEALPTAQTVLITFPLRGEQQSSHLYNSYVETHGARASQYKFVQLGSTGIFTIPNQVLWVTRHSAYDRSNARAIAEDELLALGGCVINLTGLWGGTRHPRNWIDRVASTKEKLKEKNSLHLIHGQDVARAVLAVHRRFDRATGQRFILTDLLVRDWWVVILSLAGEDDFEKGSENRANSQVQWIGELLAEQNIRALPRSMEQLGRCYDSKEFWTTFQLMPARVRV